MTDQLNPPTEQPPEPACPTCRHVLWAVALGLGIRCRHPANNPGPVEHVQSLPRTRSGDLFPIPHRHFVCPHYEPRPEDDEPAA